LSGGGALGVAHIGIIQAIEEAGLRIDYITGTSMGALVGGLYAIGYSSDQLMEIAQSNNFTELFLDRKNRRYISNYEKILDERTIATFPISRRGIDLPAGIITGQNIYTYLSRLTWSTHGANDFNNFPIPFAAIGTDIETGEAEVFNSGYLPDALRASISLPSIFIPHEIDGRLYMDGGLIRNLPVEDAIKMGANYTIAVNVGTPLMPRDSLNTLASIVTQTMLFRVLDNVEIQKKQADYYIDVTELNSYNAGDFNLAERFIEIGQREGQKHMNKFKELAALQSIPPPPRPGVGDSGKLPVSQLIIEGNTIYDDEFIRSLLEFTPGLSLSPDLIEEKINRLYSSQFIDLVTYRVIPNDDYYYSLKVNIHENIRDEFKLGLRYESDTQASILLEGSFHNLIHNGSLTRAEIRLGDRMNFKLDHAYYGPLESRFALLFSAEYQTEEIEWYQERTRVSRFKNEVIRLEVSGANYFSTNNMIALGIRQDFVTHTNVINSSGILATENNYHAGYIRFMRDRLNRKSYPTQGERFVIEGFYSDPIFLSQIQFSSSRLHYTGWYPVSETVSLNNTLTVGFTTGRELPFEYWNSPNRYHNLMGMVRFSGINRYRINSRNIQMASIGIQLEPFYHRFIGLDVYAGRFMERWNLDLNHYRVEFGVSMTLGAQTILGPIKLILSNSSISNFNSEIQIGYQF
jgi:NTE family protein